PRQGDGAALHRQVSAFAAADRSQGLRRRPRHLPHRQRRHPVRPQRRPRHGHRSGVHVRSQDRSRLVARALRLRLSRRRAAATTAVAGGIAVGAPPVGDGDGRTLGSYQLLSQLAVGGMAEIYVARTHGVGGFEKLVALKIIHPNFSTDPDFVQMLVDEAKLSVQLQLVHRDVSPQNILVSYDGEVKIVDFGIAKAALRGQQTAAGVIKGKYYYMSPEQAWGDRIDARTDIFSAGILLYEMIVGQMLY